MRSTALALALLALAAPAAQGKDTLKSLQKDLARALHEKDVGAARTALVGIGELDDKKSFRFLIGFAMQTDDEEMFAVTKEGLAALKNDKSIEEAAKVLSKPRGAWEPRALVAEAFAGVASPEAEAALIAALEKDPVAVVRREAARSLGSKKSAAAVSALADAYVRTEQDQGREFLAIRKALVELTGFAYATGEEWKQFAKDRAPGFDFEKDRGQEDGGTSMVARPTFFGSEIASSRVVFVVDTSGSMKMWDPNAEFPEDKYPGWPPTQRVRMDRTKAELQKTLEKLTPNTQFNIIAFSSAVRRWQKDLVPASKANLEKAKAFVERLQADGGTSTDDALKEALEYEDVDTIYLLSDGAPEKYQEEKLDAKLREDILSRTRKENRYRKVVIHCLGFATAGVWPKVLGPRPDSLDKQKVGDFVSFMQSLAQQNGGDFTQVP